MSRLWLASVFALFWSAPGFAQFPTPSLPKTPSLSGVSNRFKSELKRNLPPPRLSMPKLGGSSSATRFGSSSNSSTNRKPTYYRRPSKGVTNSVDLVSGVKPKSTTTHSAARTGNRPASTGETGIRNSHPDVSTLLRVGGAVIGEAIRKGNQPQWQPDGDFRPPRNASRYPHHAVNRTRSPAAKKAAIVRNTLPVLDSSPRKNAAPTFAIANEKLIPIAKELDSQVAGDVAGLQRDQDAAISEAYAELLKTAPSLPQSQRDALEQAIKARDLDKLRELTKGLNPLKVTLLENQVRLGKSVDDFATKVQNGASAAEIQQASAKLSQLSSALNAAGTAKEMNAKLDRIGRLADARDALLAAIADPNTNPTTNPPGDVPIVTTPDLPEGTVTVLPGGQVVTGTGGTGGTTVSEGDPADALGIAVPAGAPLAEDSDKILSGIVLQNPQRVGHEVNFTLNGQPSSLKAGQMQELAEGRQWTIVFDRGGSFGTEEMALERGTYAFSVSAEGWKLTKVTFAATIDNAKNRQPFYYQLDGKSMTVASNATARHESDYPMLIVFDMGDGGTPAHKRLENDTYRVGLDLSKRRIELFAAATATTDEQPKAASSGASEEPKAATSAAAEQGIPVSRQGTVRTTQP